MAIKRLTLKLSYRLLFFYVSGPRVFLEAAGLAHAASQPASHAGRKTSTLRPLELRRAHARALPARLPSKLPELASRGLMPNDWISRHRAGRMRAHWQTRRPEESEPMGKQPRSWQCEDGAIALGL
jgi:hypothetical protein